MIRFEQVTRRYESGGRPALDDVTVEFYRGDFAFLIGASGSGKSTLLRMILREGLPQRGKVTVAGQNLGLMLDRRVPDFRRSIGMVFQDFRLLPDKTVFDNVAFAMRVLGTKRSAIRKRVTKVLEKVDLAHLAKRYPHEISGGEQQRAAIARAIVNGPAILLADEPTGNLDPRASAEVMKVLRWINASGTTVIMATHDRAIVDQAHSRVVQLHRGRLVRDEPHGFYDAPEGSEAWDVLAQEEGESGLRAHDPAPLKTGVVPMIGRDPADGSITEESLFPETDQSTDLPSDGLREQSPDAEEDLSVLAFENDPVLQETTPQDYAEELEGLELTPEEFDAQLADPHDFPTAEQPAFDDDEHLANPEDAEDNEAEDTVGDDEHGDDGHDDNEHGDDEIGGGHDHHRAGHNLSDDAFLQEDVSEDDEPGRDDANAEFEDPDDLEETSLRVTWPEHLRQETLGHDVPELHGDFNGTELPDLEQDGYAEEDFEVEEPPSQDHVTEEPVLAEPIAEESLIAEEPPTGEIAPIPAPRRRLPPMYPTLPPAAQRPASQQPVSQQSLEHQVSPDRPPRQHPAPRSAAQPDSAGRPTGNPEPDAATRSRLSWLAHVEEDDAAEPTPAPQETAVPRPLPRPQSSAAQSTYTDARRTAEHLGISRSRRSILRRLRRDV